MNLLQKENTNAISLLEQALQYVPGWNDALMVSPPPSSSNNLGSSCSSCP